MIDSSGTVSPPSAPSPSAGTWRYTVGGVDEFAVVVAVRRRPCPAEPGRAASSSAVQATSSAPVCSTGMPVCRGVVGEQLVAAAHQARFQGAGLGVESGVQDRGVGLAGAVADVGARVDASPPRARRPPELARDGRTDDAGADDDDVVRRGARRRRQWRVSSCAAVRHWSQEFALRGRTSSAVRRSTTAASRASRRSSNVRRRIKGESAKRRSAEGGGVRGRVDVDAAAARCRRLPASGSRADVRPPSTRSRRERRAEIGSDERDQFGDLRGDALQHGQNDVLAAGGQRHPGERRRGIGAPPRARRDRPARARTSTPSAVGGGEPRRGRRRACDQPEVFSQRTADAAV